MTQPQISVIVPIRDASQTATATLRQLIQECSGYSVEVIASISSFDRTVMELPNGVRLLTVDRVSGVPQLRREALLVAAGKWIVITEDHCLFPPGWLQALIGNCERYGGSVCGGPVANGRNSVTGWAQYLTRYSAFIPGGAGGPTTGLPGNNACYPRALIFQRLKLLQDGFWEAEFNDELRRSGIPLRLVPEAIVTQDQRRGTFAYTHLRFQHGRCYGARRSRAITKWQLVKLVILSPFLPGLLFFRIMRSVMVKKFEVKRFLLASPLILSYVFAWSAGELTGYLAGAGESCHQTD